MFNRRKLMISAAATGAGLSAARAWAQAPLAIDEGGFIDVNGVEQWLGIRGYDAKNPVMLFLHGGPGVGITHGSPVFDQWERLFTIGYWDQPWSGATCAHNVGRDQGPIAVERYVRDAITVAERLKARTGAAKIVLFGISFGTRLGVEIIHRRPDLVSAYVGTAQVTSGPRGSRLGYDIGLAKARERGDAAGVAALESVGPPPYNAVDKFMVRQAYTNPPGLPPSAREVAATQAVSRLAAAAPPQPNARSIPRDLPAFDVAGNFLKVQAAMFEDMARWDIASLGRDFKVPVFVFHGSDDLNTPMVLAREWVGQIRAPKKAFAVIEGSTHNTMPFHDELLGMMEEHVLPLVRR